MSLRQTPRSRSLCISPMNIAISPPREVPRSGRLVESQMVEQLHRVAHLDRHL